MNADDILGRFGGEEFVIVLEGDRADSAWQIANTVRSQVQRSLAEMDTRDIAVTVSIGLARLADLGEPAHATVDALLDAGDRAMYQAKAAGRNRVAQFASEPSSQGDIANV